MITGIFHTAITVQDMPRTLHFYCEILGGRHIFTIEQPAGHPYIESVLFPDGTFLEFFYSNPKAPLSGVPCDHHFALITDNIFDEEKNLRAHQVEILSSPKIVRDGNWQLWCLDPNGYRVEIMQISPSCPQRAAGAEYCVLE